MRPFSCSFLTAAACLLLSPAWAQGQQRAPSEAATAEQHLAEDIGPNQLPTILGPSPGEARNVSVLQQTGNENTARLDQQSLSVLGNQAYVVQAGDANLLRLSQVGAGNSATAVQQGTSNSVDFSQNGDNNTLTLSQRGNRNQLTGQLDGDRNKMNVVQDGTNNQVNTTIQQSDRVYDIKQYGANNTLTQLESTQQLPKGYSVEMRGQGINLTIEQSKIIP